MVNVEPQPWLTLDLRLKKEEERTKNDHARMDMFGPWDRLATAAAGEVTRA